MVNDFEIAAIAGKDAGHSEDVDVQKCLSATSEVLTHGSMQLVVAHFPGGAVTVGADGAEFLISLVNIPTQSMQGTYPIMTHLLILMAPQIILRL
ncbi:MAG: hypothetical protein P8M25_09810 [Paracoccaceae bacterium]|nr:hypothetical protein [Paracoccaceae bacterium]